MNLFLIKCSYSNNSLFTGNRAEISADKMNFFICLWFSHRAALAAASQLYDSVDHALHQLVQVSNQRGGDLEALGQLARLVDKLEKVCIFKDL